MKTLLSILCLVSLLPLTSIAGEENSRPEALKCIWYKTLDSKLKKFVPGEEKAVFEVKDEDLGNEASLNKISIPGSSISFSAKSFEKIDQPYVIDLRVHGLSKKEVGFMGHGEVLFSVGEIGIHCSLI